MRARDDRREAGGVLPLERGLDAAPLLAPRVAVGGEEAVAPIRLDAIEHPPLAVVLMVVLQDVLHVRRMGDEKGRAGQRRAARRHPGGRPR